MCGKRQARPHERRATSRENRQCLGEIPEGVGGKLRKAHAKITKAEGDYRVRRDSVSLLR